MKLWSINALSEEMRMDRRTVKKRLSHVEPAKQDDKGAVYHGRDAFPALFGSNGADVSTIDESEARLKAAQADIEELKRDRLREEVIETETAYRIWEGICAAVRQKMDSLPAKIQSRYRPNMKSADLKKLLQTETDEILADLAKPVDYFKPADSG